GNFAWGTEDGNAGRLRAQYESMRYRWGGFAYDAYPALGKVCVPMWFPTALAVWWSWRKPKARAERAFPVVLDQAVGEAAAQPLTAAQIHLTATPPPPSMPAGSNPHTTQ